MRASWLFLPIVGLILSSCDGLFGPWKKENPTCTGVDCAPPPPCQTGEPGCMAAEDGGVPDPCTAASCTNAGCWEALCLPALRGHVPTSIWINSTGTIYLTTKGGKIFTVTQPGTGSERVAEETIAVTPSPLALNSIFGVTDDSIWAGGTGSKALHRIGPTAWTGVSTGIQQTLFDISATNDQNVWAVGSDGQLIFFDGTRWNNKGGSTGALNGVWSSPEADAYAVGDGGTVFKYSHTGGFTTPTSLTSVQLNDVWGRSKTDIWIVGGQVTGAIILHFDGSSWTKPLEDNGPGLTSVWGDNTNVWFVGHAGRIMRTSGTEVVSEMSSTDRQLTGVFGTATTGVFAVGTSGVLLRRTPN